MKKGEAYGRVREFFFCSHEVEGSTYCRFFCRGGGYFQATVREGGGGGGVLLGPTAPCRRGYLLAWEKLPKYVYKSRPIYVSLKAKTLRFSFPCPMGCSGRVARLSGGLYISRRRSLGGIFCWWCVRWRTTFFSAAAGF